MEYKLLPEQDVWEYLGVKDGRSIKKKKIIDLVSSLPYLDKEVAKEVVKQFPAFKDFASTALSKYADVCKTALENSKSTESIKIYQATIEQLQKELDRTSVMTHEEKNAYINKMLDIADRVHEIEVEDKEHQEKILKYATVVTVAITTLLATTLGIAINTDGDLPKS